MDELGPEFRRCLAALFREHMRQKAEIQSLRSILDLASTDDQVAGQWTEYLNRLRETDVYRSVSEEHEAALLEFEGGTTRHQVASLVGSILQIQLQNQEQAGRLRNIKSKETKGYRSKFAIDKLEKWSKISPFSNLDK
jgi:hypothetical protein